MFLDILVKNFRVDMKIMGIKSKNKELRLY